MKALTVIGRFAIYILFFVATWVLNIIIVAIFSVFFGATAGEPMSDLEIFCFLAIPTIASLVETISFSKKWRPRNKSVNSITAPSIAPAKQKSFISRKELPIEPVIPVRQAETSHSPIRPFDTVEAQLYAIDCMEGHEFEHWCATLLRKIGFINVVVTQGSGDQGVDVLAEKDGIRYAIQCKCYSKDLGNKPVQEVNSGKQMPEYHCQIGAVMTNRYFTKGARDLAFATGTLLWDRDWIANHLHGRPIVTPTPPSERSASFNDDCLIEKTIDVLMDAGYVSASILQQKLGLEFSEAEQVLKILEDQELVSHSDGRGFRSLLITQELWSIYKKSHT